jgi:hypothetical protein
MSSHSHLQTLWRERNHPEEVDAVRSELLTASQNKAIPNERCYVFQRYNKFRVARTFVNTWQQKEERSAHGRFVTTRGVQQDVQYYSSSPTRRPGFCVHSTEFKESKPLSNFRRTNVPCLKLGNMAASTRVHCSVETPHDWPVIAP